MLKSNKIVLVSAQIIVHAHIVLNILRQKVSVFGKKLV